MKCPCCNEMELHAVGENLVCPTCGVFRENQGEFRLVAAADGSHGSIEQPAGQSGLQVDGSDSSGRHDADSDGLCDESQSAKGNDGDEGGGKATGKGDSQGRGDDRPGLNIEIEIVELR